MRRGALILAVLLLAAIPAAAAHAGTFVVQTCGPAAVNNAWHATTPPPGVMEVNESCQSPWPMQGPWVRDVLGSSSGLTDGQGAWLVFDAAPGTRIAGITYKRWLWKVAIQELQPALSTGEGVVLETCSIQSGNDRCQVGGDGTSAVTFTGLDTGELRVGVGCEIPPGSFGTTCPGGGTQHGYGAVIYDAAVTIEDDTAPAAPAVADAGLWSGASWYRGSSAVTVSGADASGIAAVRVYADGQLLTESAPACDFTRPKPCADASGLEVPVDTTQLSDGEHDLAVALVDAAGNESPAVTRKVLIANQPPGTPQLTITPAHSGSPGFTASWMPAPGHLLPIALAHLTVCHVFSCSQTTSTASSVQLSAPGAGTTVVLVYLEDAAGNADPASAASATFTLDPPVTPIAPTTTPPDPAGPSPAPTGGHPRAKTAPRLRVAFTTTASRVRMRVRTDPRVIGSVRVAIRWQLGRDPAKRRWSRLYRRRVPIRDGQAALSVGRPPRAQLIRVVVSYDGNVTFTAAHARRTLPLR